MNKPVILCVDDEQIVLSSLKDQLKKTFRDSYDIEVAPTGKEALDLVTELANLKIPMPVIIVDQVMPGMKGDELLAKVHYLAPYTRSIMLTGQADAQAVGNAVNLANLYRYMAKPWDKGDLLLTVKEALNSYYKDKTLEEKNYLLESVKEKLEFLNEDLSRKITVFNRFVPSQFLKMLNIGTDIDNIELGMSIATEITVLFGDFKGYTKLAQSMTPHQSFQFILQFFSSLTPYFSNHNGFVDKYIGDAVMALFADPDQCLAAAVDIQKFLIEKDPKKPYNFSFGIGINTGHVSMGILGGTDHMESTVIGDTVNIASRTEELTRKFNVPIIITSHTKNKLDNPNRFSFRRLGKQHLKGRQGPIDIYEVLDALPNIMIEQALLTLQDFNNALESYEEKDYEKAKHYFSKCISLYPTDPVSQYYLKSIESGIDA